LQVCVTYLGFVINGQDQKPPKGVRQLCTFVRLIDYYSLRAFLNAPTEKDVFCTKTPECRCSFNMIKATLSSFLQLTHFDRSYVIASVDAEVTVEFTEYCRHLPQVIGYVKFGELPEFNRDPSLWRYYNRRDTQLSRNHCGMLIAFHIVTEITTISCPNSSTQCPTTTTIMKMLARS
ncbi:hypothetical protein COOONC_02709, partial [Cooperia oncophora]